MRYRPSSERTRSRRWRSGTRNNKKSPIAHRPICGVKPRLCLLHSPEVEVTLAIRITSKRSALAMRLTPCEQRWVDDVRAGRPHAICDLRIRRWHCIEAMRKQIFKYEMMMMTHRVRGGVGGMGMDTALQNAIQADIQAAREAAIMASAASYPRRMDISDRWYPRGQ